MKWRNVIQRLYPYLLLLMICAAVVYINRCIIRKEEPCTENKAALRDKFIPAEKQYESSDKTIAEGIRVLGPPGIENISIGIIKLRKMKVGFFRIGSFNEAVIKDMNLVVNKEFFCSTTSYVNSAAAPKVPRIILQDFISFLSFEKTKVSSMIIDSFSLVFRENKTQDVHLVRCKRMVPVLSGNKDLILEGSEAVLRNVAGEQITCKKALFSFDKNFQGSITVNNAWLITPEGTSRVGKLSFPLSSMTGTQTFLRMPETPPPEEATSHSP